MGDAQIFPGETGSVTQTCSLLEGLCSVGMKHQNEVLLSVDPWSVFSDP